MSIDGEQFHPGAQPSASGAICGSLGAGKGLRLRQQVRCYAAAGCTIELAEFGVMITSPEGMSGEEFADLQRRINNAF